MHCKIDKLSRLLLAQKMRQLFAGIISDTQFDEWAMNNPPAQSADEFLFAYISAYIFDDSWEWGKLFEYTIFPDQADSYLRYFVFLYLDYEYDAQYFKKIDRQNFINFILFRWSKLITQRDFWPFHDADEYLNAKKLIPAKRMAHDINLLKKRTIRIN